MNLILSDQNAVNKNLNLGNHLEGSVKTIQVSLQWFIKETNQMEDSFVIMSNDFQFQPYQEKVSKPPGIYK